jgi:MFS family permease
MRGAAFGLRQSLDTVGAFAGPLLATGLMLLWADDFRAVFWVAVMPGVLAVALLWAGMREPGAAAVGKARQPDPARTCAGWAATTGGWWRRRPCSRWPASARRFWCCAPSSRHRAGAGAAGDGGDEPRLRARAYPFGKLSDRVSHSRLLARGLVVLIAADLVLAASRHWGALLGGVALWGMHMGMTQGLLATMVADTAPADLRGTAFGFFNLVSGVAMLVASLLPVCSGTPWARPSPSTLAPPSVC